MSSNTQSTADRTTGGSTDERSLRSRAGRAVGSDRADRLATAAMVAGGALLASGRRARRRRTRVLAAVSGLALLATGAGQRLRGGGVLPGRSRPTPEEHPRGTAAEPDVEAQTPPDAGRIQFTEDQHDEPRPKPGLEQGPNDPRVDRGEERVTVNLSEAALADEASEAAGPTTGQSLPTQTADPEPEARPEEEADGTEGGDLDPEDWRGNPVPDEPFGVHWHETDAATGDDGADEVED